MCKYVCVHFASKIRINYADNCLEIISIQPNKEISIIQDRSTEKPKCALKMKPILKAQYRNYTIPT